MCRSFVQNSKDELNNSREENHHLQQKLEDRHNLIQELSRRCDYIETSNRELMLRLREAHANLELLQRKVSPGLQASWRPNNYWRQLVQNMLAEAEAASLECMEISSQLNAFFNKLDSADMLQLKSPKDKHARANSASLQNDLIESKIEYHVLKNKYVKQKEISNYLLYQLQIYKSKELMGKKLTQPSPSAAVQDKDALLAQISPQDVTLEPDLMSQRSSGDDDAPQIFEQISFQEQGDQQTIEVATVSTAESLSDLRERMSIMQHNYQQTIIELEESKNQDKHIQSKLLRNLMKFRKRESQIGKMIMLRAKKVLTDRLDDLFRRNNKNDMVDMVFSMWRSLLDHFNGGVGVEKMKLMNPELFISKDSPFRVKSVRYSEDEQYDWSALNDETRLVQPGDILLSVNSVEIGRNSIHSVRMLVDESPGVLVDLEFFSQRHNQTFLVR